jgi:hypothetical protein
MKFLILLITSLQLLLLSSCGDLFMKNSKKDSQSQFATCQPDTSAFSKIFTANIRGDLICLGENLNLFADIVKSDKPGMLSHDELKKYLQNNMDDIDPSTYDILRAIFNFNSILTGDNKDYIGKANIDKLIDTFILFNKAMVQNDIYDYFVNEEEISYEEHLKRKAKIYFAFTQIEHAFYKNFKMNSNEINFKEFIDYFKDIADPHFINKVHKVLFVKRIFIGGEPENLNAVELKRLLGMLADASKIIFDIAHLDNISHSDDEAEDIVEALKEDFDTLVRNLYIKNAEEKAFHINDVFDVLITYFPEYAKYTKYKDSILHLKNILLRSNSEFFYGDEVYILLNNIVLKNLQRGVFFFKAYETHKDILESPDKIVGVLPSIPTTNELEESFEEDFNRIARDYRGFKGTKTSAFFTNDIKRSALGMFEVATMEDLVTRLFSFYVSRDDKAYGGYQISLGDMERIMTDFKEVLRGEGIMLDPQNGKYKPREANTSETITLMTSLFQYQSSGIPETDEDDPKLIEVNEMTEFAITVISAAMVADKAYDYFAERCELDDQGRFLPSCYRAHFLSFFDEELSKGDTLADYMPKLKENLDSLPEVEITNFLEQVEVFSRSCTYFDEAKTEEVPMVKSDFLMIFGGIMAMESTFNRFDTGDGDHYQNNILDIPEVERAYDEVYQGAVKALIPGKFLKKFGKSFYFYLVKYNKLPDVQNIDSFGDFWRALKEGVGFIGFLLKRKHKKQAPASRFTLAMVLRILAEQSETNITNPYPCEVLR